MNFINGWTKEKVIKHVKENFTGYSTSSTTGDCAYRGNYNKKCIAGCFIPDDAYSEDIEGKGVGYIGMGCYFPFDTRYMEQWQGIHDSKLHSRMSLEEQLEILLDFLERE